MPQGLWRFEPGPKLGATVYRYTYINTTKTAMSFSDFPMPREAPNFMHNSKVMDYYRSYADRYGNHVTCHYIKTNIVPRKCESLLS